MLHVAPEPVLTQLFRKDFDYLSADLDGTRAMVAMDITRIGYQDGYFDAIMCNHVLEHVPDDRQALAELCRVMAVGGWGCIQVPMKGEQTQEDLSIVSPADRARLYGQEDHVRQYGTDFRDRLQAAGFFVRVVEKSTLLSPEELERFSVACEQEVVLVRKLNRKGV
jgi:SAM-dependent methyltransferase